MGFENLERSGAFCASASSATPARGVLEVTSGLLRSFGQAAPTAASATADWPVEGLLAHIAGQGESTFRVVDVWESEEALDRFAPTPSATGAGRVGCAGAVAAW